MKRDARIGLAVVLVLGLSVTLLIGRALYKTTPVVEDTEHDPDASATASAEVRRVDGAETSLLTGAAATPGVVGVPGAPAPAPLPATGQLGGEFAPPAGAANPNPAVQQFIDNQTRQYSSVERSAGAPTMSQETAGLRAPAVAGNTKGPPTLEDALQDHEVPVAPNKGAEAAAPSDGFGYTVAAGDNMWKISTKVYGDGKYTQKIVEANKDFDTAKLKVGSVIRIPLIPNKTVLMKLPSFADAKSATKKPGDSAIASNTSAKKTDKTEEAPIATAQKQVKASERTDKAAAASEPVEATTHKIESGETLGSIARKHYGFSGPKSIQRILDANKGLDAAKLKVGQEINIPAKK